MVCKLFTWYIGKKYICKLFTWHRGKKDICKLFAWLNNEWRSNWKDTTKKGLWVTDATMYEWYGVYIVYAWMYEYLKVLMFECTIV